MISNDERLFSLSSVTSPASRNEERRKLASLSGKKANRKSTYKKKNKENQAEDSPSKSGTGEGDPPISMDDSHQESSEPL